MSRNVVIGLVAVVVAVAGYYFWNDIGFKRAADKTPAAKTSTESEKAQDPLVGIWQSIDDAKFTREFYADGSFVDKYEGDPTATQPGEWRRASRAEVEADLAGSRGVGMDYLILTIDGEAYHFGLVDLTDSSLRLVYLDRGGVLSFSKIK